MSQSANLSFAQPDTIIIVTSGVNDGSPVVDGGEGGGLQADSGIVILSDGSVKGTDKIKQNGNVYTFTGDISGTIKVQKSGITIDGAGYTIHGGGIDLREEPKYLVVCYGNVEVKNLQFDNCGIYASSDNNIFINNHFTGGSIFIVGGGLGNIIKRNVFTNSPVAVFVDYNYGKADVITENDFINSSIDVQIASPVIDRNYYSDYRQQNPNAKVIDDSNMWDTSYKGSSFVDQNPLVKSISGYVSPYDNLENQNDNLENQNDKEKSELFSTALIIATLASIAVISTILLIYFKGSHLKNKKRANTDLT